MRQARPYPYVAAIIQAREKSERFPGKIFKKIGQRSLLEHVIARAQAAESIHAVVVATPDKRISDIAAWRGAFDYWYRGDENNVLDRYVKAAEWCNCDVIVRLTSDCPLIDPDVIDMCVVGLENNDICSNVLRRRFPKGMDVEVFHRDTLYRMERLARDDPFWKEHVTYGAYSNPQLFRHKNIDAANDYSWINLSVDTPDDLRFVRGVYNQMQPGDGYKEISEAVSEHFRAFIAAWSPSVSDSEANGRISSGAAKTKSPSGVQS